MFRQDKSKEEKDLFSILMDDDNTDPIVVFGEDGERVEFLQVAVLPHEDCLYCILKPITPMKDVAEDEAIPFQVVMDEDRRSALDPVTDTKLAMELFDMYYDLIEEHLNDCDE